MVTSVAPLIAQRSSDEALVERARNGEHAAFVVLVARWADREAPSEGLRETPRGTRVERRGALLVVSGSDPGAQEVDPG